MQSTPLIAFDHHAATTVAAVLLPGHRTPALHSLSSDIPTILRFVSRLQRHGPVACCYEAGPCGFELQRALTAQRIPCDVIAPALIPRRRRRSDQNRSPRCRPARGPVPRRGADRHPHPHASRKKRPAICCAAAKISAPICSARGIGCPNSSSVTADALPRRKRRGRNATTPGCAPRRGRCPPSTRRIGPICAPSMKPWRDCGGGRGPARAARSRAAAPARPAAPLLPRHRRPDRPDHRRRARRCTPLCHGTESDGLCRARSRRNTRAGRKHARGAITKTGNAHLRRVLVEAAWHYRHHPFVSAALRARQRGAPPTVIAHAWTAQQRLHRRYHGSPRAANRNSTSSPRSPASSPALSGRR